MHIASRAEAAINAKNRKQGMYLLSMYVSINVHVHARLYCKKSFPHLVAGRSNLLSITDRYEVHYTTWVSTLDFLVLDVS